MSEVPPKSFRIELLKTRQLPAFIKLRREIEAEAEFLPVVSDERQRSSLFALLYNFAHRLLHRKRIRTLVALEDDRLIGYAWMVFARFKKFRGNAYLATVSIRASHRGRGIGSELIRQAERIAVEHKMKRLELEVFAKNARAVALYQRLGYELEGRKRFAVRHGDESDDVLIMAKLI